MTATHRLWEALGNLRERGWHQGGMEGPEGQLCIAGALSIAYLRSVGFSYQDVTREKNRDYLRVRQVADELTGMKWSLVAEFNDDPSTTWELVEQVLEKAAIRADEVV